MSIFTQFKGKSFHHKNTTLYTDKKEKNDVQDNITSPKFRMIRKINSLEKSNLEITTKPFKKIVVIGDSLSDCGEGMFSKTFRIMPSAPQYFNGRFTNGYTWVDFISSPKYMNVDVINKSEGGAVSGSYCKLNPIFMFISSMKRQIKSLKFSEDELAIVSIGANDYITFHKKDIEKVVKDQSKNIKKMIAKGAKNIVVMGIPDLSTTPYAKNEDLSYQEKMKHISMLHNKKFSEEINKIKKQSNVNISFFDTEKTFQSINKTSKTVAYNTDNAFHKGYIGGKGKMNIAPNYIFNDSVHPTQEAHAVFAMKLHSFISKNFIAQYQHNNHEVI